MGPKEMMRAMAGRIMELNAALQTGLHDGRVSADEMVRMAGERMGLKLALKMAKEHGMGVADACHRLHADAKAKQAKHAAAEAMAAAVGDDEVRQHHADRRLVAAGMMDAVRVLAPVVPGMKL